MKRTLYVVWDNEFDLTPAEIMTFDYEEAKAVAQSMAHRTDKDAEIHIYDDISGDAPEDAYDKIEDTEPDRYEVVEPVSFETLIKLGDFLNSLNQPMKALHELNHTPNASDIAREISDAWGAIGKMQKIYERMLNALHLKG